jgi:hypothetical protein
MRVFLNSRRRQLAHWHEFVPRRNFEMAMPGFKTCIGANFMPRRKNSFKKLPSSARRLGAKFLHIHLLKKRSLTCSKSFILKPSMVGTDSTKSFRNRSAFGGHAFTKMPRSLTYIRDRDKMDHNGSF